MTHCDCGHANHHHNGDGCHSIEVFGPPTPAHHAAAPPELHMGRTLRFCPCRTTQPGTGDQVQTPEKEEEQ